MGASRGGKEAVVRASGSNTVRSRFGLESGLGIVLLRLLMRVKVTGRVQV